MQVDGNEATYPGTRPHGQDREQGIDFPGLQAPVHQGDIAHCEDVGGGDDPVEVIAHDVLLLEGPYPDEGYGPQEQLKPDRHKSELPAPLQQ
jgi:hypothetical protein